MCKGLLAPYSAVDELIYTNVECNYIYICAYYIHIIILFWLPSSSLGFNLYVLLLLMIYLHIIQSAKIAPPAEVSSTLEPVQAEGSSRVLQPQDTVEQ